MEAFKMTGSNFLSNGLFVPGVVLALIAALPAAADDGAKAEKMAELRDMAPAAGYVEAHKDVEKPYGLLGGSVKVSLAQNSGGVFVALPAKRELDSRVFGDPEMPRAFAGSPGINGVPPMARETENGEYTEMKKVTPFGDKHMVLPDGRLRLDAVDATATDAARSDDSVSMVARWKDKQGNTYEVRCCQMLATHGLEYPTFGGVMTNHILHGFTRIGTALMPSEFAYLAFWGMGEVLKNGEVVDKPRLIHGMLTEYVRTKGYELASDSEVTPTRRHFHLMVAPFMPHHDSGHFEHNPVKTGLTLPNGMELPFWHVMFENLEIDHGRLAS